ncbi:MAG TPA: dihydrofolate reductase [Burkholderiales bacterium]|nr:dihydrofolate reductase [Burkholderiales bacterium]
MAMSKNRVIGADGKIPWHLPDELKLFKSVTMGHHILMGRKTWDSIGRLLPGRTTVIVTRQPGYRVDGATVAHSLEEAVSACGADDEIFVIGGADIFRAALPLADRLYLTTVDAEVAGDVYMPEFAEGEWREVSSREHAIDERHPYAYRHAVLERAAAR